MHLRIADWALNAATLAALAQFYERTPGDFLRLNQDRGWGVDELLPPGTEVRVPDPDITYLVASYLSALVMGTPGLDAGAEGRLIQSLAPMTVSSSTALDMVLARLLLVTRPAGRALYERLPELERAVH